MTVIDYTNGVESFYKDNGKDYKNPHEDRVVRVLRAMAPHLHKRVISSVIDIACGSGEASLALLQWFPYKVTFVDPYTKAALLKRIPEATCLEYHFLDLIEKEWPCHDLAVVSYAYHLLPKSLETLFCMTLASRVKHLLLVHPHKKRKNIPHFSFQCETKYDQTVAYLYESLG